VKTTIQLACFIAAFVTMLSRVSDYRHRGSDVIGGSVLGTFFINLIILILNFSLPKYFCIDRHFGRFFHYICYGASFI
jgi:membrane-associated phospholipid phosphatase